MEIIEGFEKTSKGVAKESISTDGFSSTENLKYYFTPWLIYSYAMKDPIIRAAINKKAIKVLSGGWSIEPITDEPNAEEQADAFMEFAKSAGGRLDESGEQINFDGVLFKMLLSLMQADELYVEVRNQLDGKPGELLVQDWEDMRVKLLKGEDGKYHGEIEEYHQVQSDKITTRWEPQEIIHRNLFAMGTRKYGTSLILSVMSQAAGRMFANSYANNIFVNQKPKGIWYLNLSETEYKKTKDEIKEGKLNPNHDLVINQAKSKDGSRGADYVPIPASDMQYQDFIKNNRIEILVGLGVPPGSVYLPIEKGGSGWNADVQLHEFDEDINFIRTFIENIINDMLLPRFGYNSIRFRINRSNKRDEEREAKIVSILSPILTINQRREIIGYPSMKGGDIVVPDGLARVINPNMDSSPEGHEELDQTQMEGVGAGRELSRTYQPLPINTNYSNKNYFRKSTGTSMFNKAIKRRKPNIYSKKDTRVIDGIEKRYMKEYTELLKNTIENMKEVVGGIGKIPLFVKMRLKKVADPAREIESIEAIKKEFVELSKILSSKFIGEAWEYGVDAAQIELDMPLSKVMIAGETLDVIEKMNIDIVEGAASDLAKSAKFHIREGVLAGESISQITFRLENMKGSVEKVFKNRMRTIARTEVSRAVNMGSLEAYKNSNVVKKVQVLIGPGPDEAGVCASTYDGPPGGLSKEFDLNTLPPPPLHPNCMCVVLPVVE